MYFFLQSFMIDVKRFDLENIINLEKTFELQIYTKKMTSAFAEFGCSKPKRHKDTYALNVL